GRTLAASPKSRSKRSHGQPLASRASSASRARKELLGSCDERGIGHVALGGCRNPAEDLDSRLVLVGFRETVKGIQELLYGGRHELSPNFDLHAASYQERASTTIEEALPPFGPATWPAGEKKRGECWPVRG